MTPTDLPRDTVPAAPPAVEPISAPAAAPPPPPAFLLSYLAEVAEVLRRDLHGLATVAARVRKTHPDDAAQLVASARAHALDALATFGTCLSLARIDLGPLPRIAEDVALGLLGIGELYQAVSTVKALPLPHHVEAA